MSPTTRQQARQETPARGDEPSSKTQPLKKMKRVRLEMKDDWSATQVIALGVTASLVLMAAWAMLIHRNIVRLEGKTRPENLGPYHARLEFTLRYQVLGIGWLIFAQMLVMWKRFRSGPAVDPTSGFEDDVQAEKNILTNSVEQFICSSVSQLILVSYLPPTLIVKVIPGMNLIFLFGRLLFWIGYPKFRTCGHMCTVGPTMIAHLYNLHKFGQHLGMY